jgi:hypothetical protein
MREHVVLSAGEGGGGVGGRQTQPERGLAGESFLVRPVDQEFPVQHCDQPHTTPDH